MVVLLLALLDSVMAKKRAGCAVVRLWSLLLQEVMALVLLGVTWGLGACGCRPVLTFWVWRYGMCVCGGVCVEMVEIRGIMCPASDFSVVQSDLPHLRNEGQSTKMRHNRFDVGQS